MSRIRDREVHSKAATRQLKEAIERREVVKSKFTPKQLEDIYGERPTIEDLTWHHHQDTGRMQLIPRKVHEKVGHIGGMKMWYDEI